MTRKNKVPEEGAEPKKKKTNGKANRERGHGAERLLAQMFREIGFDKACTTRASSRLLDACGIDLNYVPVIIQSKAGAQKGMKVSDELKYIQSRMNELLPIEELWHGRPKAVVQIKPASGRKRDEYDSIVSMTLADFMKIISLAYCKPT